MNLTANTDTFGTLWPLF